MLKGFFSSEAEFARDFTGIAHRTTAAAKLLVDILTDPTTRTEALDAIAVLAREANATAHAIQVRVAKVVVTPIDREDVGLLASRLGGILIAVGRTARMSQALNITETNPAAVRLAETLSSATAALEEAVTDLKDGARVTAAVRAVKEFEQEGDGLYGDAMTALFAGTPDPLDAFRWKEMYGLLEDALDDCAHAAGAVEALSLKRL